MSLRLIVPQTLLFSVTRKDLTRQTFCTGGNGGQHRNATQNGVRLTHAASGAVGEGRVHREQYRNERLALRELADTVEFRRWHKTEVARRLGVVRAETPEEIMTRVDGIIEQGLRDGSVLVEDVAA